MSVLLIIAVGPVRLSAQQAAAEGTVTGTVLDPDGTVVPNATIVVKGEGIDFSRTVTTGEEGRFTVSGMTPGTYTIDASKEGFATTHRPGLQVAAGKTSEVSISLSVGAVSEEITVTESMPVAAQLAPLQNSLEARSAESVITEQYIEDFTSPEADYTEITQMVPGSFSVTSNGIGLGQGKTYFRGFADGDFNMSFDNIPFFDTNTPTHHSWSFFPNEFIGGVVFDRSPGTAATIGPTPFGGSIYLQSRAIPETQSIRPSISYGTWNTLLKDLSFDSGKFGSEGQGRFMVDAHQMTSNGYETYNFQKRTAFSAKLQYALSPKTILTLFSAVVDLRSNTPNTSPTRAQIAEYGDNYDLSNNPSLPNYYGYNTYHVPTDFEYVGIKSDLGSGWTIDNKVFTYWYWNQQFYNSATKISSTSATDKLNGYRKVGDIVTMEWANSRGVFRTGMWAEQSWTNRYQIPSSPLTHIDSTVPNFHEKYTTPILQPYVEFAFKTSPKLTITPGFKLAFYEQNFVQYADNGGKVGNLNGAPYITNFAAYHSYLPSIDAHYMLERNWSLYGQFGTGSVIPPTSVFDVVNGAVLALPKPTTTWSFQEGTVWKSNRYVFDFDTYYVHFQNTYSSSTDPTTGEAVYYLTPDSITKGVEAEMNIVMLNGLSLYLNGTGGSARYVGTGQWVADTPQDTAGAGLSYQMREWDLGFFDKRIGQMWNDNGSIHQAILINPFNMTSLYLNYTVKEDLSALAHTKVRLSFNNLWNKHNIVGVTAASTASNAPNPSDQLTTLPGRSITFSFTAGLNPKW